MSSQMRALVETKFGTVASAVSTVALTGPDNEFCAWFSRPVTKMIMVLNVARHCNENV